MFPYGREGSALYACLTEGVIFIVCGHRAKLFCNNLASFSWWGVESPISPSVAKPLPGPPSNSWHTYRRVSNCLRKASVIALTQPEKCSVPPYIVVYALFSLFSWPYYTVDVRYDNSVSSLGWAMVKYFWIWTFCVEFFSVHNLCFLCIDFYVLDAVSIWTTSPGCFCPHILLFE